MASTKLVWASILILSLVLFAQSRYGPTSDCGFADRNCKMNMYCVKPGHNRISCLRLTLCVNLLHLAGLIVAAVALIQVYTTCIQKIRMTREWTNQ
ncbi:unnamed protein product [Camellia sinensis]